MCTWSPSGLCFVAKVRQSFRVSSLKCVKYAERQKQYTQQVTSDRGEKIWGWHYFSHTCCYKLTSLSVFVWNWWLILSNAVNLLLTDKPCTDCTWSKAALLKLLALNERSGPRDQLASLLHTTQSLPPKLINQGRLKLQPTERTQFSNANENKNTFFLSLFGVLFIPNNSCSYFIKKSFFSLRNIFLNLPSMGKAVRCFDNLVWLVKK